jgi:3-oxoacyl-[acyl-carrier-protein] synthase III
VASIQSIAVLRQAPRPTADEEVAPGSGWRGVCEYPGGTPAQMAVHAGRAALATAEASAADVGWVVHSGSGPQGSQGWPVHHHIQHGIVGCHGNAVEIKQNCAGGLTSWLLGSRLLEEGGVSVCTGADNWDWSDRFVNSRTLGGEPLSDAAHAVVIAARGGWAKLISSATASSPDNADDWRTREGFWQATEAEHFGAAYARATSRSDEEMRDSFRMFVRTVGTALTAARLSPQYVTHFVPQGSGSGQPYRSLAKVMGLPWSEALFEHTLDHGYLGVSTQADGLVYLAEAGDLKKDSIVLLLASEYQLSSTALVLRVMRAPQVSEDAMIRVIA